jgi:hypothetical protein
MIQLSLQALSKAVDNLQQKVSNPSKKVTATTPTQHSKGQLPSPKITYAATAAARPTRASLVMHTDEYDFHYQPQLRPQPSYLTEVFNWALKASPHHQIHITATKCTANRNLILTGGHMVTAQQLQNATDTLAQALVKDLSVDPNDPLPPPPTRPNVKWSKLLINSVSTGVQEDRNQAYSSEECQDALVLENPSYASLLVTQKPSWVCPPSSYSVRSSSSLVVAFEDPDGGKAKALLAERYLYAFGTRVSVKRWKQRPPKSHSDPQALKQWMPTTRKLASYSRSPSQNQSQPVLKLGNP